MGRIRTSRSIQGVLLAGAVLGCGLLMAAENSSDQPKPYTTWQQANGSSDSANFSALTQINRSNVASLQVAWTYDSGDKIGYAFQPLVVGRIMYAVAKNGSLVAVDATNGKEIWVHPFPRAGAAGAGGGGGGLSGYRGLNFWESKDRTDQRILVRASGSLQAIDAKTGQLVATFGDKGRVDLKIGMTRAQSPESAKSPGQIFENLIILGSATGEAYGSTPADLRAFDVVTGKLAWVFHTIPHPGEYGYDTWPKDAWTYAGGAGNWGEMSVDEKRGIVYIPTGTPKYEFWGGDRHGDTLFANCILALDARTGKRIWHYQTIHHDVWEYELVAAPILLTVRQNGKPVDIVAQASKNGFLYVLDRVTGKPVWPIPELPVPKSDVPGEKLSPTQPFPSKPPAFTRQSYTVEDIDTKILNPSERAKWKDMVLKARNQGLYTPFGLDTFTVMMPGHSGGASVFSTSADPATGTGYVISFAQPGLQRYYTTAVEADQNIGRALWGPPVLERNPLDMLQILPRNPEHPQLVAKTGGNLVAEVGRAMYEQTCQQCHGATLAAEDGGAPSLIGVVDRLGEGEVRNVIREGRSIMPTFATMAESDLNALVVFLRNPALAPSTNPASSRFSRAAYPPGVDVPKRMYTAYGVSPLMITPPYSTITAYDLNQGTIKWQVPYGEAVGLDPPGNNFGIVKLHGPKARLAITAGGLAFSATIERKVRAFDKDTGKVLWTTSIPDGAEGTPAVYEVDGREYVVFCVRGSYIAYALPVKS